MYWHLTTFPTRQAAEAAKSATGIVVEEDGRVWLSEFRERSAGPSRGTDTPMELHVTGTALRRAFALVIHDGAQDRGIPSHWQPAGACSR